MNRRWMIAVLMLTVSPLIVMAQEATTRPTGMAMGPDTQPSQNPSRSEGYRNPRRRSRRTVDSAPAVMPAIYDAVGERNIFIKGDQHPAPAANTQAPAFDPNHYTYSTPANELVLTGVSLEGRAKVAFLEDQQEFSVKRVQVGDSIAQGKVVNLTLDALDYKDHSGNTIRVAVGFNLAGGNVWGAATDSGGAASTQPSVTGPRAPGESMEDYLRRRRAAELGH